MSANSRRPPPPRPKFLTEPADLKRRRQIGKARPIALAELRRLASEATVEVQQCRPSWPYNWLPSWW
jgi:hypothetical protein